MQRIEKESTFATEMQHIGNLYSHKMTMAPISSKGIRRKNVSEFERKQESRTSDSPGFFYCIEVDSI